jgi:nucleoside-diphosphate kinase
MEKTLLLIKPDAVKRRLAGRILEQIEDKGLTIAGMKMFRFTRQKAEEFYSDHAGKSFFEPLVKFMTSGPIIAVVLSGKSAVAVVRKLIGKTDASQAEPGTIRGDFGLSNRYNLVHASDSKESFDKEVATIFDACEIVDRQMDELICFPEEL